MLASLKNLSTPAKVGLAVGVGVVGYIAYTLLREGTARADTPSTPALPEPSPAPSLPSSNLPRSPETMMSRGGRYTTLEVQKMLKAFADYSKASPGSIPADYQRLDPGPVNGAWNPPTWNAVMQFQRIRGLAVDGEVGPRTSDALDAVRPQYQAAVKTLGQSPTIGQAAAGAIQSADPSLMPRRALVKTRFGYRVV